MRFFLSQTALERSRLALGRVFLYVRAILSAFSNSRRDRSERSDFALTKTCDETGRRATPICLLSVRAVVRPRGFRGLNPPPTVLYCHSWKLHKTDEKKWGGGGTVYVATSLYTLVKGVL